MEINAYELDYEDCACECAPENHTVVIIQNGQHLEAMCKECGASIDIVELDANGE